MTNAPFYVKETAKQMSSREGADKAVFGLKEMPEFKPGCYFTRYDFDWEPGKTNTNAKMHFCYITAIERDRVHYLSFDFESLLNWIEKEQLPKVVGHCISIPVLAKKHLSPSSLLSPHLVKAISYLEQYAERRGRFVVLPEELAKKDPNLTSVPW